MPRPIVGARKVAGVMLALVPGGAAHGTSGSRWRSTTARQRWSSTTTTTWRASSSFEVIDGKITNLYAMRNPDKLVGIAIPRTISR